MFDIFSNTSGPISIYFVTHDLYDKDIDSCRNSGLDASGSTSGQKHVTNNNFDISSETSVPILTTQYAASLGLGFSELLKLGARHVEIGGTN